jgi:hypothetical protein
MDGCGWIRGRRIGGVYKGASTINLELNGKNFRAEAQGATGERAIDANDQDLTFEFSPASDDNAKSFHLYLGPSFPSSPDTPVGEELDAFSIDPQCGLPLLQIIANTPDNSTARCFAADPQGRFDLLTRRRSRGP